MQTSSVYTEKEEHRIPEGNPVRQEGFGISASTETEHKGPKPTTLKLTSNFQKLDASFSSYNKSL